MTHVSSRVHQGDLWSFGRTWSGDQVRSGYHALFPTHEIPEALAEPPPGAEARRSGKIHIKP